MGTTADKLNKLLEIKAAIKNAIIAKGVEVADSDIFASYPAKIEAIEVGSTDDFLAMRTNNGTNMSHLFYSYQGIDLDVSSWNTDNVTNMEYMFYGCINLTSLDLSNFNTNNVTNMESMFDGCINLERLDLSNFIINSSLYDMLVGCDKLQELRLDNCDNDTISKIINSYEFPTGAIEGVTRKIYVNPDNLGDLKAPENWIFVNCKTGEEIGEPEIYQVGYYKDNSEITEVTTMVNNTHTDLNQMFYGCNSLTTINNIEQWDTSNVTDMFNMFYKCNNLTTLDLSSFDTSKVTSMGSMFYSCSNLNSLDLSNFDTSKVINMSGMFIGCNNLTTLDLSNFDTSKVTNMSNMLGYCTSLHTLRLDNCSNDTINKIITSPNFPTNAIEGITRKIYCKEENAAGLTPPENWTFDYIS